MRTRGGDWKSGTRLENYLYTARMVDDPNVCLVSTTPPVPFYTLIVLPFRRIVVRYLQEHLYDLAQQVLVRSARISTRRCPSATSHYQHICFFDFYPVRTA